MIPCLLSRVVVRRKWDTVGLRFPGETQAWLGKFWLWDKIRNGEPGRERMTLGQEGKGEAWEDSMGLS